MNKRNKITWCFLEMLGMKQEEGRRRIHTADQLTLIFQDQSEQWIKPE